VLLPTGEMTPVVGSPAIYGPEFLAADSAARLRELAGDGGQVFLAPAAALPSTAAASAIPS
jgi:hypothetical protein